VTLVDGTKTEIEADYMGYINRERTSVAFYCEDGTMIDFVDDVDEIEELHLK
jgi:hypothetical protein